MLYISIFLLLNIGCISQSYIIRPREKVYSKRNLDIYPDLARMDEEGGKKEGGGEGQGCEESRSHTCNNPLSKTDPKAKASNIAQKAAQEAKAANDAQMAAADAAASQVKVELAEKALQSARAAEAALAGKQQIVEQLEMEHHEAEAVVQEVNNSLHNTQTNAAAANDAAAEARNQLAALMRLVQAATTNLANIENVSMGAQQELAEKTQLLEAARNRVGNLANQLQVARQDFEKTKKAAYKAACAAVEAKQKAQRSRRLSPY
ncbi:uncharacterized protein LOC115764747 isoform X2 [Drosophila novamexicana]|uniref:uncharacterized protein LOC115764747 isoform X2 n=1 Tax=Drosophila novamexicana TaxID=47314 RepID=UPI0011E5F467|nr:uncharacterized protein LOC115764747 isoform X2 [Drosophila novamexicana]